MRQLRQMSEAGELEFEAQGDPPEYYEVNIETLGLAPYNGSLGIRKEHQFGVYLHRDYPRRPPVIHWKTPIFHPNILGPDRNGGVCLGAWSASESLPDLIAQLVKLVNFRSFNLDDALDSEAAAWLRDQELEPGFNLERVVGLEPGYLGVEVKR